MNNLGGKLSFGFSKIIKKPNLVKNNPENEALKKNIEMIDSIEESKLNVLGKNLEDDIVKDLIIPLTDEQKSRPISKLIESRRKMRNKQDTKGELLQVSEITEHRQSNENKYEESLEQRAAREILEDTQNRRIENESKILELPIHPDKLPLNGASESTIEDYDRIPIADFGKAMLRGMGWKDDKKNQKDELNNFEIFVRPKGLGLGADKVVKKQKLLVNPAPNETLEIKKNAFVKILAGKHKNLYGTIEGFDDGGGRLIVKLAIGGLKVQMNEFMCQPVAKQEFIKYSKVLNSEKYEEYKNDEGKKISVNAVNEEDNSKSMSPRKNETKSPSTSRTRNRSRSHSLDIVHSESHYRKKRDHSRSRKREMSRDNNSYYSSKMKSNYLSDSEDDKTYNRKYNEKHKKSRSPEKHRRRHSSSDSNYERSSKKKSSKKSSRNKTKKYSSDEEKVHKRKYKRSKHHRDRS